jgi:chloramphenicol O-acetyltransferase type B
LVTVLDWSKCNYKGLSIGTGAVIGMGSVVTKDVKPYSIVADCPAKVIKKRFDATIINKLLESKWWNYKDEQLL